MRFNDISYNFNVVKVLSILVVVCGHYGGGILWIPSTFGLFIFGFSSGFFTSQKYHDNFNVKKFWYAKVLRLWSPILVIDLFLLGLFLIQHKTGILSWQTLFAAIGMSGLLNWFSLPNPSPFGAGLWFFTLLIIFYSVYPFIALICRKRVVALSFLIISFVLTTLFNYKIIVGHALWITAFSFISGSYWGIYSHPISPKICLSSVLISLGLLIAFNTVIDFKQFNYSLILLASLSIVGYLLNKRLPDFGIRHIAKLSGCVIQIYFIHTYLFVKSPNFPPVINFIFSMTLIITTALLLSKLSEKLSLAYAKKT